MSGEHEHASAISAAGRHERPLVIALVLTVTYEHVTVQLEPAGTAPHEGVVA